MQGVGCCSLGDGSFEGVMMEGMEVWTWIGVVMQTSVDGSRADMRGNWVASVEY